MRDAGLPVSCKQLAVRVMQESPGTWNTVGNCRKWIYGSADRLGIFASGMTHNNTGSEEEMEEFQYAKGMVKTARQ